MTVPQLLEHRIDTLFEQLPLVGRLGQAFQEAGHELHLVGGSVRDALMGTLGHDLDFTTDATPDQPRPSCAPSPTPPGTSAGPSARSAPGSTTGWSR